MKVQVSYPGFEGDELKNHFHCEDSCEHHVENVHSIIKAMRLAMMLFGQ